MKAADQIQLFKVQSESTALCHSVMQPVTADDWLNTDTSFSLKKTIKLLQMHFFVSNSAKTFFKATPIYITCPVIFIHSEEKSVDRIALKFFQFEKK